MITHSSVKSICPFVDCVYRKRARRQIENLAKASSKCLAKSPLVNFISFTGSVPGGKAVAQEAVASKGFKGVALELGGKDPAYVRADADFSYAVEYLVDGKQYQHIYVLS